MRSLYQLLLLLRDGFLGLTARGKVLFILIASTVITSYLGFDYCFGTTFGNLPQYLVLAVYLISWCLLLVIGRNSRKIIVYSIVISAIQFLFVITAITRNALLTPLFSFFPPTLLVVSPLCLFYEIGGILLILFIALFWLAGSLVLYYRLDMKQ